MPENDIHVVAVFIGVILLFYTEGLPPFMGLLFFMFGAIIASFKRLGFVYGLSPDLDSIGIIKKLTGHRSIIFHSPLIPVIILKFSGINFACEGVWESRILEIMIYGLCFGWLIHIIADGIQSIEWWDVPFRNTKRTTRLIIGVICVSLTLATLLSVYFINSQYLQFSVLPEILNFFRNLILYRIL